MEKEEKIKHTSVSQADTHGAGACWRGLKSPSVAWPELSSSPFTLIWGQGVVLGCGKLLCCLVMSLLSRKTRPCFSRVQGQMCPLVLSELPPVWTVTDDICNFDQNPCRYTVLNKMKHTWNLFFNVIFTTISWDTVCGLYANILVNCLVLTLHTHNYNFTHSSAKWLRTLCLFVPLPFTPSPYIFTLLKLFRTWCGFETNTAH